MLQLLQPAFAVIMGSTPDSCSWPIMCSRVDSCGWPIQRPASEVELIHPVGARLHTTQLHHIPSVIDNPLKGRVYV